MPTGEDGSIRAWTAARGKLCGTRTFSAFSNPDESDKAAEESKKTSLDDRIEGPATTTTKRAGDVPVPVCALASYGPQPLIAVGLCHGTVHIVFVKQVTFLCHESALGFMSRVFKSFPETLCWLGGITNLLAYSASVD